MNDSFFRLLADLLNDIYWRGTLLGEQNLPKGNPAVFVANHLGPKGPIGSVCTLPVRVHPWIKGDMLDPAKAPDFLRLDFIEPVLKFQSPLSLKVALWLSKITVPLMSGIGCIPVYTDYDDLQETLRLSVGLLVQGQHLLIFPEDPDLPMDKVSKMRPFRKGLVRVGESYYQETGNILDFYPVAVHESGCVRLGKPIQYRPFNPPAFERLRIKNLLEQTIRRMYLEMSDNHFWRFPLTKSESVH
jgi:hypothetical protein